ncbi:hypothetical protein [Nocardia fluminea]|uniref:hypothetical protein n=1 Tax=Nocardia fluminea TaxID=134984 RepID=UPI003D0D681A
MTTNTSDRPSPADGRWTPVLSRPAYPELNKPDPEPEPIGEPEPESVEPPASAPAPAPVAAASARVDPHHARIARLGTVVVVGVVAVAGISLAVQKLVTPDTVIVPMPPPGLASPGPEAPVNFADGGPCTSIVTPAKVQGNGIGGTDSGPRAILAFEHAYYTTRSATQAREVVAPDAAVSPAETIQKGIDSIPVGTVHCVTITPQPEPGTFVVEIVARQRASSSGYRQIITTTMIDGRHLITNIASAPR